MWCQFFLTNFMSIKKVLLISAPFEEISLINASDLRPKGIKNDDMSHYPLGFAYLYSYLEPHGYTLDHLFLNNHPYNESEKKIIQKIFDFQPDVVGLQIFTQNRVSSFRVIEMIEQKYPSIQIVIGGIHTTVMYKQILKRYPRLIAVLGEGEVTFLELLSKLKSNTGLNMVRGIAFNNGGNIIKTKERPLIDNIDNLPFPKHKPFFRGNKRQIMCLMTSRGCPFACSFCCLDSISRRRVRLRSPENVIKEIEEITNKLPQIKKIWIEDDNFFIDNQRVVDICDLIIKKRLNKKFSFVCSGRIKPVNQKMLFKLKEANFKKILMGLESGDDGILKKCHKGIQANDAILTAKMFAKADLDMGMFLIIGLPGENMETIKNTAKVVKKIQKTHYLPFGDCSLLVTYPGTEVYELAKKGGAITDDFWMTDQPTPVFTLENSIEEIQNYKRYLLKNISYNYLLTFRGIISQFFVVPQIFKFFTKNKSAFIDMLSSTIKLHFPEKVFNFTKLLYNKLKTH